MLEFSQEQLKDDSIQFKLNTITNQIDNHLAANFYELVAAWQQARAQSNTWVAQLTADLKKTQQHQNKYQEVYQTVQTELQELQTQLKIMNEDHQATLHQIQNQDIQIQHLETVINQFNITFFHTFLNLCASFWKIPDSEKFDDKLSYLNWKIEMINKIQLDYNQKKESEEIKRYIFSYITEVLQNQLQSHLNHLNWS